MVSARKKLKLGKSYLESLLHPLPLWVHLWVTNRCNLSCDYCYVVDNKSSVPSTKEVKSWIAHADKLGTAIIAFMGGEPTLRGDLPEIISSANERNLISYLTSNGKLLTHDKLVQLAKSGLDILEVSLDGYGAVDGSQKTLNGNEDLIDRLQEVGREYGMRFKIHQVLSLSTLEETPKLLDLAQRKNVPISFGRVYKNFEDREQDYENRNSLERTLKLIIQKKKNGIKIINPTQYFEDAITSLNRPIRINCDIGRYMVQVSINGKVYVCSKLKEESDTRFLDIDKDYFRKDKHRSGELLERCSHKCLSACAYTTNYFREHPLSFISTVRRV